MCHVMQNSDRSTLMRVHGQCRVREIVIKKVQYDSRCQPTGSHGSIEVTTEELDAVERRSSVCAGPSRDTPAGSAQPIHVASAHVRPKLYLIQKQPH